MEIELGIQGELVLRGFGEFVIYFLTPVFLILQAGSHFGTSANATAIRERAGDVLLDVGRSKWAIRGSLLFIAGHLFFLAFYFACFLLVLEVWPFLVWTVAMGMLTASQLARFHVGFRPGRLEIAVEGLLISGKNLLRWEEVTSWKWRAWDRSVLIIHTGVSDEKTQAFGGMVRQFTIPEQYRVQVNRLMLEYRGNQPLPTTFQDSTRVIKSA